MADSRINDAVNFSAMDRCDTELHGVAGGTAAVATLKCPGKQSDNEDAAVVIPFDENSAVLAVADGMGGAAAGEKASAIAIGSLVESMREAKKSGAMLRTAILNGFEAANEAIQNLGCGAGTTLVAAEVCQETVRPYHVGDSIILLIGGRGKVKLQSIPHSPVGYGVEAGFLDELEAIQHEDRHIVSNVLGSPEMRIEIGPTVDLAPRDTLLLATDGLADNLQLEEICRFATQRSLKSASQSLTDVSLRRMADPQDGVPSKPDDLTIILYRSRRHMKI